MPKTAFLTIDDFPSPLAAEKMAFLKKRGIPALFFCTGNSVEAMPELAMEAIHLGFTLGNHSWDHPHFSDLTVKEGIEQIRSTQALLEKIHQELGVPCRRIFRFPYGDKGGAPDSSPAPDVEKHRQFQDYLREAGYSSPPIGGITYAWFRDHGHARDNDWYWTYDCLEWCLHWPEPGLGVETLQDVFSRMDEDLPERGRGLNHSGSDEIVLMHDHVETHKVFFLLIDRLEAKGLVFRSPF